jgi:long-chain fatty acid transport protein
MLSSPQMRIMMVTLVITLILCLGSGTTTAQILDELSVPLPMDPVGSGARAIGMGGAFIAVADDATAASWNPAGLIQLETPEVSVVGAYYQRTEKNTFGTNPEASGEQDFSNYNLNYLSAVYPFSLFKRNMIVSASHQYLYDFSRSMTFPASYSDLQSTSYGELDIDIQGGLTALGIAYSVQVSPNFSAGFTLNFWQDGLFEDEFKFDMTYSGAGTSNNGNFIIDESRSDTYSYRGFNTNLGLLWTVDPRVTIGFVVKTPFTVDLEHTYQYEMDQIYPANPSLSASDSRKFDTDEELDIPRSYGLGIAYRYSDNLTTSLDLYRIEWDDFIYRDEDGAEVSPITGRSPGDSQIDPTHQIRVGVEYLRITDDYVIPIRGGIFYDPAPGAGEPDPFYGYSCGTGFSKGKIVFDVAYQYRFGRDVAAFILEDLDFSQDMREQTLYASVIYHF